MAKVLEKGQIEAALKDLPGWRHEEDALVKTFKLKGFSGAVAFIVRVGFECQKANHHPELSNIYNKVTLRFTTHSEGGVVTENDVAIARTIERIL